MNRSLRDGRSRASRPAAATDPVSFDDRYDIRRLLGSGGMSRVMLAYDRVRDEDVALKLLHRGFARKWLTAEFRYISSLDHPGIVKVHDFGVTSTSRPYFTMERVEGPDLYDFSERADLVTTVHVIRSALDTLRFVHARGVVHCDLKPSNILVASDGQSNHMAKLLDFGVAWGLDDVVDNPGGTMDYMAPETLEDGVRTPSSDLYSMGVVLFEILTGRVPFAPGTTEASARALASRHAPDPRDLVQDTPGPLAEITMRLLERRPADRFMSARALSESLRMWAISVMPRRRSRVSTVSMLAMPKQAVAGNPRLIGRESALKTLMDSAERVERDGIRAPQLLTIVGESGCGASSLISEARLRVQLGGALWVSADLSGATGTGEALARLASVVEGYSSRISIVDEVQRALLGDEPVDSVVGGESPIEERLIGTAESVAAAIQSVAKGRPLTVCLDHVDELASSSIAILRNLIKHLIDSHATVVLSGDGRDDGLIALLKARPGSAHIELQPLGAEQTREMVVSMLGECATSAIADHVFTETGGNPRAAVAAVRALVASEAVREREGVWHIAEHLSGHLPSMSEEASVRQVALASIAPLTPTLRRVAELGAVIGETWDAELLAAVLRTFAETLPSLQLALRKLTERRIVVRIREEAGRDCYKFSQPAIRSLLIQGVAHEETRVVSGVVALELKQRHAAGEQVDEPSLARHLVVAGRHEDAIEMGRSAVNSLLADGSGGLAEELLGLLVEVCHRQSGEDERWAELTSWLGDLARRRGDFETAMRHYAEVGSRRGDPIGLLTQLKLGDMRLERGEVGEGRAIVGAVLDASRQLGAKAVEGRAAYVLGFHHVVSGNYNEGEPFVVAALEAAEFVEDDLLEAQALKLRSLLGWYRGDLLDSEDDARESARICIELGLNRGAAEALGLLGGLCKRTGRLAESRASYEEALVYARRAQWLTGIGKLHNSLAVLSYYSDAWDNACAHYAQGLSICERTGNRVERALLLNNLALVSANRGEDETALELYEESLEVARACGLQVEQARVLGNLGEYQVLRGMFTEGESSLKQCLDICMALGSQGLEIECRRRLLEHDLAVGRDIETVLDRTDALSERATGDGFAMERAHLYRVQGEALAMLGLPEEAEIALAKSRDGFQTLGCGYESARAVRTAAMVAHRGLLDPDGVAAGFPEARRLFRSLGANPELELSRGIVEHAPRSAAATPPPHQDGNPSPGWSPSSELARDISGGKLVNILKALGQASDSREFWERFCDACLSLSHAQRAYLIEVTPQQRWVLKTTRQVLDGQVTSHGGSINDLSQAVLHHVVVTRQPFFFVAGVDAPLSTSLDVLGRSIVCIPIIFAESVYGLICMDHREDFVSCHDVEADTLDALAAYAAPRLAYEAERGLTERYGATLTAGRRILQQYLRRLEAEQSRGHDKRNSSPSASAGAESVEQIRSLLLLLDDPGFRGLS